MTKLNTIDSEYTQENREAWEEAFAVHQRGWKTDPATRLLDPEDTFLDPPVIDALRRIGIEGKVAGQFCCNNGRELLSVVKMGAREGIGFDFAENFIREARRLTQVAGLNARFVAADIADIPSELDGTCDVLLVTAGALCWFEDLTIFFEKASQVLRSGGTLLIHEIHPFTNLIAMPDEPDFDKENPERIVYSYFKSEPWAANTGMDYVGGTQYESKTFTSFAHRFAAIVNAIAANGLVIQQLEEYPDDISASLAQVSGGRLPLSYLLIARRP